ncbi:bifunctional heptose 7-phosphate kinase/heptose 1-phosphate adenyltransferase [Candidatus Undinarchaeota archaeon]
MDFLEVIAKFKTKKIIIIGDLMLDKFIWGDVNRVSPEFPVPIVDVCKETYALGGACNVSSNIRNLGSSVFLAGVTGDDADGAKLLELLKDNGIATDGVFKDPSRPTTKKARVYADERQIARIDFEKTSFIPNDVEKKIIDYVKAKMVMCDAVIFSDYAKGAVTKDIIATVMEIAKKQGMQVFVDSKSDLLFSYKGIECMAPNKKEASEVLEMEIKTKKDLHTAGKMLLEKLNAASILITLGEDGMVLFQEGKVPFAIPAILEHAVDITGAGDTVMAAFSLSRVSGANLRDSAVISNIAASIAVSESGIHPINITELREAIANVKG